MRAYSPRAGAYSVPASPCALTRPNRQAAGMAATAERKKRVRVLSLVEPRLTDDALRLSVRGTLDPLAAWRFDLERVPCGCCGSRENAKLRLKGKPRSRRLLAIRLNPSRLP